MIFVRIMASNIWGDYFGNPVDIREEQLGKIYEKYDPDILAMQEATPAWNNSKLYAAMKDKYTFVTSPEAPDNNYVPLVYRTGMFEELESGFVKFPDTPDKSKGATWAVLKHIQTGKLLAVFGTHFWYQKFGDPEHDALRVSNAHLITKCADELCTKYDIATVALGDMNSFPNAPAIQYLRKTGWRLARDHAKYTSDVSTHHGDPQRGEDGLYHGRRTTLTWEHSIDHIAYRGNIMPERFVVIEDQDALDPTDHSPIYCDFAMV